jgi:hypothetical protein
LRGGLTAVLEAGAAAVDAALGIDFFEEGMFFSQLSLNIIGARKKGPDHAVQACKSTL